MRDNKLWDNKHNLSVKLSSALSWLVTKTNALFVTLESTFLCRIFIIKSLTENQPNTLIAHIDRPQGEFSMKTQARLGMDHVAYISSISCDFLLNA